MVQGQWRPPYILQYEHTTPYWYQVKQLFLYSMGLPLGILSILGTLFMLFRVIQEFRLRPLPALSRRWQAMVVLLAWVLPVFWLVGGFYVKFLRYMLPLIPFFCLVAAIFVENLWQRFSSFQLRSRQAWRMGIVFVLLGILGFSAFYSIAFVSIYQREDPRVQASRWIYDHV